MRHWDGSHFNESLVNDLKYLEWSQVPCFPTNRILLQGGQTNNNNLTVQAIIY